MNNAVIEKPEFPGASTVEPVFRLTRHSFPTVLTEKPSGLNHANATNFPYEDEDAMFEQQWYREVIALPENGDETWTEAKNQRRCDLIDHRYAGNLTPAETVELAELQEQMLRHRQRVAPLPLEDARRLYQELLTRVGGFQLPTET
jgi:hypothetical protein